MYMSIIIFFFFKDTYVNRKIQKIKFKRVRRNLLAKSGVESGEKTFGVVVGNNVETILGVFRQEKG